MPLYFKPRTSMPFPNQPLLNLPMWLSKLFYMRGIDTDEKAQKFLYPSLSDRHDPFLMKGMEIAVKLIKAAIQNKQSIVVYGDYDVDGICATAILVKTLSQMGARVHSYLPDRHTEGYGLNPDAVKRLAKENTFLMTVDCGISNVEEVALARSLGMTVVVTDHHEPPDQLPQAHAILNPLLGYPFARLCGAGVALKLSEALVGFEAVEPLLPICALATVADIVPLIDENRLIVSFGLKAMPHTECCGLKALMESAAVTAPVTAQQVAFRLAPRLNAAGRLKEADIGLRLLLTDDETEAKVLAQQLENENTLRRKAQDELQEKAQALLPEQVDFKHDKAIVIVGDHFNPGVIGLCAGKLCEKYYYPTIVLSRREDDTLVGSARSIPGVNIHKALTQCKDLFVRFGGHAQAAGLTMQARFLPELRRRLSLAIDEIAVPECYVEHKEYDLLMPLSAVTEQAIQVLEMLEPTGYGNPSPVFLTQDASIQQMRQMGQNEAHLSVSLLADETLRKGVFFSAGALAAKPWSRVDVLYTPQMNEWQGRKTVQLMISAMKPTQPNTLLPGSNAMAEALLQDLEGIASNTNKIANLQSGLEANGVLPFVSKVHKSLFEGVQGTLVIARTQETALKYAQTLEVEQGHITDVRGFHTLLVCPDTKALNLTGYRSVLLADGVLNGDEVALIRAQASDVAIYAATRSKALSLLLDTLNVDDETLREAYKGLVRNQGAMHEELPALLKLTPLQMHYVLRVFDSLHLLHYTQIPFVFTVLPPAKCELTHSPLLRALRAAAEKTIP